MPNRLSDETSPYLLHHAHNPVDWYPWGEEAFERARRENKPLLVSIGYAACHWCHVMERESFENEEIARLMNEHFVCMKVDREERPDVDGIYMQAVQTITGRGGWPLNVFLLPDGRPFYGGTYYPPEDVRGMPSWPRVLEAVSDAFQNRRDDVLKNADALTDAVTTAAAARDSDGSLDAGTLNEAFTSLRQSYDATHGGFGPAPKFPQPMTLEFLLRYHARTGDAEALQMLERTLNAMADGGMYEQLGGGFHRYSVDAQWLVPHFEKMLYDNALLARLYLRAYQATGNDRYRRVAEETLDYLLREMRHPLGGFYSSQDADSEGVEGKFYVWSPDDIDAVLGDEDARIVKALYGVTPRGNFEGRNILHAARSVEEVAQQFGITVDELKRRVDAARRVLLQARSARVAPATDTKVLTSWNGLALRALAEAACVLDDERYRTAAEETGAFLLTALRPDGPGLRPDALLPRQKPGPSGRRAVRLLRTWKDGRAHLKGYLEDYASLVNGLLALHEATFAHRWLRSAVELTAEMTSLFWDDEAQAFFDVGKDHESLIVRPRDIFDNAVPSGSSEAAEALIKIGRVTGQSTYEQKAEALLQAVAGMASHYATGFGNWLKVMELYLAEPTEVVIVGSPNDPSTRALRRTLYQRHLPNALVFGVDPSEGEPLASPLFDGRRQLNGAATVYVCHNYACNLPTVEPSVLLQQVAST